MDSNDSFSIAMESSDITGFNALAPGHHAPLPPGHPHHGPGLPHYPDPYDQPAGLPSHPVFSNCGNINVNMNIFTLTLHDQVELGWMSLESMIHHLQTHGLEKVVLTLHKQTLW